MTRSSYRLLTLALLVPACVSGPAEGASRSSYPSPFPASQTPPGVTPQSASSSASTLLHAATALRVDRILAPWRAEIAQARAQRSDSRASDRGDGPLSFRGSLEEADLFDIRWLAGDSEADHEGAPIALVVFDRAPNQSVFEALGAPSHQLYETRTGYLVGPDHEVEISEHLVHYGSVCREHYERDTGVFLDGDADLGALMRTNDGEREALLYFRIHASQLQVQTLECESAIHTTATIVNGPCGPSLVCGETMWAPEADPSCLNTLRSLERDVRSAYEGITEAPAAFATAHALADAGDFAAESPGQARTCDAPPRAQRLAARSGVYASADDEARRQLFMRHTWSMDIGEAERAWIEGRAEELRSEYRRAWRNVRFSCTSEEGFAFQVCDDVRFFDGSDVIDLFTHDSYGDRPGETTAPTVTRFDADGDGFLDWWATESWSALHGRDFLCSETPQCSGVLVTRRGIERLPCETRFVQGSGGAIVWIPQAGGDVVRALHPRPAGAEAELTEFVRRADDWRTGPQRWIARALGGPDAGARVADTIIDALVNAGVPRAEERLRTLRRFAAAHRRPLQRRTPVTAED